jgi:CDP-paratose 2-epimerase
MKSPIHNSNGFDISGKKMDNSPKLIEKKALQFKSVIIKHQRKKAVLVTGGAGFIGINVADRLLTEGKRVIIYDNLSRKGVENNLKWLQSKHPQVEVVIADVKDTYNVKKAVAEAEHVFHFAAQVAVTSSLVLPEHDFEVNVGGTIHVLEAIRQSAHKPSLIFTSTNKVYGDLSDVELRCDATQYFPAEPSYFRNGINENHPLNFHSPYGCSKGAADQYILDYARSYGLHTIVFRMSCIYGPHQFGTEDQGWVAHFINQSLKNQKIILYGDGKQVRDILYVDDLVEAFMLAKQHIEKLAGEAFNIGGGPGNALSLVELLDYMGKLDHLNIQLTYDAWRIGDQKYYVSDIRKFNRKTGWLPKVSYAEGINNLYNWLHQYHETQLKKEPVTN